MAKAKQVSRRVHRSRDDADARGEQVYGLDRSGRKAPAESDESVRQPGHYKAGADGTQDIVVADASKDEPEPKEPQPASDPSSRIRRGGPRKIR